MPTFADAYTNALLADATYALDAGVANGTTGDVLEVLLRDRMASVQSQYISRNFTVVTHIDSPEILGSGFDGTVWQRGDGKYFVSMRGTEGFQDFVSDGDLTFSGGARSQIVDMVNWWLRITTATGNPAPQIRRAAPQVGPGGMPLRYFEFAAPVAGAGVLLGASNIEVNGHSLGGHLGTAFARIFGGSTTIGHISTFNSAGFTASSDAIFRELQGMLGMGLNSYPDGNLQTNYFARNGVNFTTNTFWFSQIGQRVDVFNEAGTGASNHFMYRLTDALALGDVLSKVDPNLDFPKFNAILEAASNKTASSLENVLDAVRRIFIAPNVSATPIGDASGSALSRVFYHDNLSILRTAIPANAATTIVSLVGMSLAELQTHANVANGLAYRYALKELNPFAILGPDSLYDGSGTIPTHNARGDLDLYDVSKDAGLTEKWLQDRTALLSAVIRYNTEDRNDQVAPGDTAYFDGEKQIKLRGFAPTKGIGFAKAGEQLSGRQLAPDADLFGSSGDDTIIGAPNKSYVEGGTGNDTITTFDGADEIHGGAGNDQIDGGDGADVIVGGKDNDDRGLRGGKGGDRIWGDEQQDTARYAGANYGGHDYLYGEDGDDFLYGGGGNDRLEGGKGTDFLFGDGMEPDDTERSGFDVLIGNAGGDFLYGGGSVDTLWGDEEDDTLIFGGNDTLNGNAGVDELHGGGGGDTLDGGADDDVLIGGAGSDTLMGGTGNDKLYGDLQDPDDTFDSTGNDQLDGGEGNDELSGGAGRDVLLGGAGDDKLRGGKGVGDYMLGGAGKDTYVYFADDGADLIFDDDGQGEIKFNDQITLSGGKNKKAGELTWYAGDPCDPEFTYSANGDPTQGPVTLKITSAKYGGELVVFDFDQGELGITLTDNSGTPPDCPTKPPTPARQGTPTRGDPLVLDLGSTGIATYGLSSNLYFDMDGDGYAEKTGWAGAQEGVLVYDKNADGILNDGQELFGDFTRLNGGQLATGGFQALSAYDANHDGTIDALDPVWSSLRVGVWETDPFGQLIIGDPKDAMSLKGLDALGITSISVTSSIIPGAVIDPTANVETRTGTYTLEGGATRQVAEFRFARDNADTKFQQSLPVPPANASDPSLPMGGLTMNLQQALIRDDTGAYLGKPAGTLRAKLDAFQNESNPAQWFARFEDLLFAWTGADAIPAGTKTGLFDARHAAVLEKAYGQSFQNPNYDQWAGWQTAYEELADTMYSSLLPETHLETYYDAIDWARNDVTQAQFGNLAAAQSMLDADVTADAARGRALVNEFARSLRGLGHTLDTTYFALREHFTGGIREAANSRSWRKAA